MVYQLVKRITDLTATRCVWWAHQDSNLGPDGMRRSTSVAGYPHRIPKTTYFGLNRPMAEVDHEEGYQGAQNISWIVTFLALMVLEEISGVASLREIPSAFFLQAAMAVMLGVSSVMFFYLNRSEEENEAEQDSHA